MPLILQFSIENLSWAKETGFRQKLCIEQVDRDEITLDLQAVSNVCQALDITLVYRFNVGKHSAEYDELLT